jgi:soluble lytic murein transglycosylase
VSFNLSSWAEEDPYKPFQKGVKAYQQKQFDAAVTSLIEVPELGAGYLSVYKHWFLGHSYMELGKYKDAEPEFAKVFHLSHSNEMKNQAQFELGEIALREKKYHETQGRLIVLERKWRRSYRLPEVLYRMLTADLKLGKLSNACRRARKLYTEFPAHPLVMSWGADFGNIMIDGTKLGCTLAKDDLAKHIRSLQQGGEAEKAHKELTTLLAKVSKADRLQFDMLMAGFLTEEGSVNDALNLLIRYYPTQKSNIAYLSLLGKAAGRSGEYQVAVGAYERIFRLVPRGKKGRVALFQAASLSYQTQDYDGAVRKFETLIRIHPHSGLLKEARWQLAWLQYLRNDYKGALSKFAQLSRSVPKRNNERWHERLLYWSAMANLRLDQLQQAHDLFKSIALKNPYSYYGLAAQARLELVSSRLTDDRPRALTALKLLPFESESDKRPIILAGEPVLTTDSRAPLSTTSPEESEDDDAGEETSEDESGVIVAEEGADEDGGSKSEFKDPILRARLEIAGKLTQLGQTDLARWELLEVERHTRNRQYLRSLISAYEGISSYNRAATIAEITFAGERESGGLENARPLWASMYPQAYKTQVEAVAKKFAVPTEWVWSIMRTESVYRSEVISPAGAKGLMQLMPFTARNLYRLSGDTVPDDINLLDPAINIRLGTQYLGRLGQKFKGSLPLVAAAYNAGPHRVENWLVNFGQLDTDEFIEHIPYMETRNYVKKVLRHHTLYRRLYAKDLKTVDLLAKTLGVPIPTRAATRETWESM